MHPGGQFFLAYISKWLMVDHQNKLSRECTLRNTYTQTDNNNNNNNNNNIIITDLYSGFQETQGHFTE